MMRGLIENKEIEIRDGEKAVVMAANTFIV